MSLTRTLRVLQFVAVLFALSWVPTAHAYCYIDVWGVEQCSLGSVAYAGIAIGCTIVAFVLLCVGVCVRRRRISRGVVYVDPPQPQATAVTTVTTTAFVPPPQPIYAQPTGGFNPYAPHYPPPPPPPPIAQPGFYPEGPPPQYYAGNDGKV